jgi:hypothetical protein
MVYRLDLKQYTLACTVGLGRDTADCLCGDWCLRLFQRGSPGKDGSEKKHSCIETSSERGLTFSFGSRIGVIPAFILTSVNESVRFCELNRVTIMSLEKESFLGQNI